MSNDYEDSVQDQNLEIIEKLWKNYKNNTDKDKNSERIIKSWNYYKEKILKKKFTLDDYTGLKKGKKDNEESYFTNFLERESSYFGSSKGGNSEQYMIYQIDMDRANTGKNDEDKIGPYYISKEYLSSKNENRKANKEEAEKAFEEKLLPLLEKIVKLNSFEEIKSIENDESYKVYSAKQMLRKMLVLNSLENKEGCDFYNKFLFIFKDETINTLYSNLVSKNSGSKSYYEKNSEILDIVKKKLKITLNYDSIKKVSDMLWTYVNTHMADFPTESFPNVIFYGTPGTGKTFEVDQFLMLKGIENINKKKKSPNENIQGYYIKTQFHPSFTYEDFIEGIKPTDISTNTMQLGLVNGIFKEFCKIANSDIEHEYYFIADEINRANLSVVFGETLSLLEVDYRDKKKEKSDSAEKRNLIDTQYSELERKLNKNEIYYDSDFPGQFGIPRNVRFIGMMNDVDKSIDAFDLALRRRFRWIRKDCDYEVISDSFSDEFAFDTIDDYRRSCERLNVFISGIKTKNTPVGKETLNLGKSYEFGHSYFLFKNIKDFVPTKGINAYTITAECKKNIFNVYLRPTLKEYLRSSYDSEATIEDKLKMALNIFIGKNDSDLNSPANSTEISQPQE